MLIWAFYVCLCSKFLFLTFSLIYTQTLSDPKSCINICVTYKSYLSSADFFFKISFIEKFFQEYHQCQTVWIQIRPDFLSSLIWSNQSLLWCLSGFSIFWYLPLSSCKYQNKEKTLKRQRKLWLDLVQTVCKGYQQTTLVGRDTQIY